MNEYLDLARLGKNDWWRYLLSILIILFLWQILGALPSICLLFWVMADSDPHTGVTMEGQFLGVNTNLSFSVTLMASVFFLLAIYLSIRLIHQRPFRTLITSLQHLSIKRILLGFGLWFLLSGFMCLVEAKIHPGRYVWSLELSQYIPFLFLALILIPIQTSAEELFFRAYILQGFGLHFRNAWLLCSISGIIFMLPHLLNPEARIDYLLMGFFYFLIGAVMAYVTLRDGKLELALGLHAANNLFSALIANYTVTVMPTPSLFTVKIMDPVFSVSAAVISLAVFVLVFVRPLKMQVTNGTNF